MENKVLRVPEVSKDHQGHQDNLEKGDVLELMEHVECQESLEAKVIEGLMVSQVFQERKDTGEIKDLLDPKVLQERMGQEERMERSVQGDCPEKVALEDC